MAANNIYIQVDINSQGAQGAVNALNNTIAQTGPAATKSAAETTKGLNTVQISVQQTTKAFGELTGALAGLGISRIVSSMVQVGNELGRAQIAMQAFIGSAAEGTKVFEEIRGIAAQSPFRFKDLEETGRRLAGFGMTAKEITPTLKIVTDQVAAMGGSIENVNSIVGIFGRVMNKDFVGAMDLMRLLPQQGVKVMDALREAIAKQRGVAQVSVEEVKSAIKEGVLDPAVTMRTVLEGMQRQTSGAGARINDFSKFVKNLGDSFDYASKKLFGPEGFGPALDKLGGQIQTLLSPLAALLEWLIKLPEPTKELIVQVTAATAAVIAFTGAWKLFHGIAGPAIEAIYGIGKAIATALVAVLTNPELLLAMGTVTAFVAGFIYLYPEQAKKLGDSATKFVTGLWDKLKSTVANLAKESGLFDALFKPPKLPAVAGDIGKETEENLKTVQDKVQQWSDAAGQTLLNALSSPVEAIKIKYSQLFNKLNEDLKKFYITPEHAAQLQGQLGAGQQMEEQAKLFDQQKQQIADRSKLEAERAKGSYEAQIAYVEALAQQDLRSKVAAIDKVTELRIESALTVARVEEDQLQKTFELQRDMLNANRKFLEASGIDVDQAILEREVEMLGKRQIIDQKAMDDAQKYRLEGWKKANDAIIEDQKRVFDAFKSTFDELFDAFTDKTKSIGQALGDIFKKLALGEVRNVFSTQLASAATEAAGYGKPEPAITRGGGGILSELFRRGMPPRAAGPPPDAYNPAKVESTVMPLTTSSNRFAIATDSYAVATLEFSRAVDKFAAAGGGARQGDDNREMDDFGPIFTGAAQKTGVSENLLRAVATVESGMHPGAVSNKGAVGLMQLMPATQRDWGVTNALDPSQNVMGGAHQLGKLLERYGGDLPSALAAYNMGPTNYERTIARGKPLPAETQAYIASVQSLLPRRTLRAFQDPGWAAAAMPELPVYPMAAPGAVNAAPGSLSIGPTMAELQDLPAGRSVGSQMAQMIGMGLPKSISKLAPTLSSLKELFGIGGGPHGQTTLYTVMSSKGVNALETMAGSALLSAGLQRHFPAFTVAGGGLLGMGAAKTLGMGPLQGLGFGVGAGLFAAGVQRGGVSGMVMDIGGGALAGAMLGLRFGGAPGALIGAIIGAGVGAVTGVVRMFVKTERERIRAQIKQVYGIDIANQQILMQIQQIVDQRYGGNVAVGVQSKDVQDIVRLYALTTGQIAGLPRPQYAATIAESSQGLQLQPVYDSGRLVQNPYTGPTTYQYESAIPGLTGTPYAASGAPGLLNTNWQNLTLDTIRRNPAAVAMANAAAVSAGDSRLTTTAAMQEPLTALA